MSDETGRLHLGGIYRLRSPRAETSEAREQVYVGTGRFLLIVPGAHYPFSVPILKNDHPFLAQDQAICCGALFEPPEITEGIEPDPVGRLALATVLRIIEAVQAATTLTPIDKRSVLMDLNALQRIAPMR